MASTITASSSSASVDPDAELMNLPADVRAIIIRGLTQAAARTLASTASAALNDVLEARTDLKPFTLYRPLSRVMTGMTFRATGRQRSRVQVMCSHEGATLGAYIPLHVMALVPSSSTQTRAHQPIPLSAGSPQQ